MSPRRILLLNLVFVCLALSCQTSRKFNYLNQGNQLARDGLYQEAIEAYAAALKQGGDENLINRNMGIVLVRLKDYANAIRYLTAAENNLGGDFETQFFLGEALRGIGNYSDALFHYRRALTLNSHHLAAMKAVAWCNYNLRLYSQGLQVTTQALREDPNDYQVHIIAAKILLKLRRHEEAYKSIVAASQQAPKGMNAELLALKGELFSDRQDYGKACAFFRKAVQQSSLIPSALYGKAMCEIREGRVGEGINLLEQAVRLKSDYKEAYFALGRNLRNLDAQKAREYYTKFLTLVADDPSYLDAAREVQKTLRAAR